MSEIHNLQRQELMKRVYWYEKKYGPYIKKRGTHNWKNLFRKPTMHEWVVLIMLLLVLFMGWAYTHDIEECRKVIEEYNAWVNSDYTFLKPPSSSGVENDLVE